MGAGSEPEENKLSPKDVQAESEAERTWTIVKQAQMAEVSDNEKTTQVGGFGVGLSLVIFWVCLIMYISPHLSLAVVGMYLLDKLIQEVVQCYEVEASQAEAEGVCGDPEAEATKK